MKELWYVSLVRWFLFITIGFPVQILIMTIYPLFYLWFRLVTLPHRQREGNTFEKEPSLYFEPDGKDYSRTRGAGWLLDNDDDHNALTHWTLWSGKPEYSLEGANIVRNHIRDLAPLGRILRSFNPYKDYYVSGDCVVSWFFALSHFAISRTGDLVLPVARHYLRNLGALSGSQPEGWVSTRCNNFGVNYCPDSDYLPIGQPMAGPQFYTSSAVFATAVKYGGWGWRAVFWAHWLLLGGWYWCWWPFVCSKKEGLGYVRDITMKALYIHLEVFGDRWWIRKPMEEITYIVSESRNELFCAMMGKELRQLPDVIDPWAFQRTYAASDNRTKNWHPHANVYVRQALINLKYHAVELWKK